ncbi:DUF6701 domain-containing protein [Marinobacter arenosus]|uniref:DUF6701 domain-containing protein n=1 Tax=Marinobacter arenosus TaxID=2856822 RepID=UPI001C4DD692|nr:DUF6701 domain-containing protein [Marinobacter arenosus]MBW0149343.1 hypothetical protein [Marinobacter arenosus]
MRSKVHSVGRAAQRFCMVLVGLLATSEALAVCSPDYKGLATINEVRQLSQGRINERFIEIKLLSSSLTADDFSSWTLSACTNNGCTGTISVGSMDAGNLPWLVADRTLITSEDYLDFGGMDIVLRDGEGRTIDYLSVGNFSRQRDASCTPAYDWEVPASNTKNLYRSPDGTGNWGFESGNSGETTEADTNDAGVDGPSINVSGSTVFQGETATFVITLDAAAGRDIVLGYRTEDSSAVQGTDYSQRSGTLTIPAGQTQASISVPTLQSGSFDQRQFFLNLETAVDNSGSRFGVFDSQIGLGIILPSAVADWHLDNGPWNGSSGEVLDASGGGSSGLAVGGVVFSQQNPAWAGDPGTCGYADFEEWQFQYIGFADSDRLDLTDQLTITAWVRPESSPLFTDTILSKGSNYQIQLDRDGEIRWSWRNTQGTGFMLRTSGANLDQSSWAHIAVVYKAGRQAIYINGDQRASGAAAGVLATNGNPLYLGTDQRGGFFEYFDGSVDEVTLFRSAFNAEGIQKLYQRRRPCAINRLGGFEVIAPPSASVCGVAEVFVRAVDRNGQVLSDYDGRVALQTSAGSGNWSAGVSDVPAGSLAPSPDTDNDGTVSYQFAGADNGTVSLALANATADQLRVVVTDVVDGQQGRSAPIQFLENAFVIESSDANGLDIVAERNHSFVARAIRRDPANGECGVIPDYDGEVDVKAWLSRSGDDPGGVTPTLDGGVSSVAPGTGVPSSDNLTLSFNGGLAAFSLITSDVGQYRLNLLDDTSGIVVDTAGTPLPISGQSALWTVRPDRFELAVTGNPSAADANGPVFRSAGQVFEVVLSAVGAEGGVLSSYGQEGAPQGADLSHTLLLPSSLTADDGVLSGTLDVDGASFNGGEAIISDLSWNEVGIIQLTAENAAYLGVAPEVTGQSGSVGRFVPDRFEVVVSPGELAPFCSVGSAFVYSGQSMAWAVVPELTISAMGPGTYVTNNYTEGDFQKLTADNVARSAPATDNTQVYLSGANYPITSGLDGGLISSASDGVLVFSFSTDDSFVYDKAVDAKVPPFSPDMTITVNAIQDSDGVLAPAMPLSVTPSAPLEIRYGRWELENVYGPENVGELFMPFRAEVWNGSRFVEHAADGCSSWTTTLIADPEVHHSLVAGTGNLMVGTGGPLTLEPKGTSGTDTLVWDVPVWFESDQDGDGVLEDPSGLATFGVYRGHDRVIYWQER